MLDNYTISWVISYDIDNKFCSKFTRKIRLKETNANKLYANYEKYRIAILRLIRKMSGLHQYRSHKHIIYNICLTKGVTYGI